MRHGKKGNHLGRKVGHRRALLKNLASALIEHKRINTTLAKAKALRLYIEPLVTKARANTTHSRRVVFSYLQNKEAVKELFGPVAEKIGDRPGGYVRVLRMGYRQGDGAEMGMIEFVDFNEVYNVTTESDAGSGTSTGRKRRRRGGGGGGAPQERGAGVVAADTTTAIAEEEPLIEEAVIDEEVAAVEDITPIIDGATTTETTDENKTEA